MISVIPHSRIKKLIVLLFLLNCFIRFYGIWFPRWAWDEPFYCFSGINIINFLSGLVKGEWRASEIPEFFNVIGIVNKYICFIPALLSVMVNKMFHFETSSLTLCAYLSRFFLGFLPNILIIYVIQKIIRQIWNKEVLIVICLFLFLLPFRLIETSIYGVADSLVTLFLVSSILFLIKFLRTEDHNKKLHYLRLNALFVCLAVSTKINVGIIAGLTSLVIMIIETYRSNYTMKDLLTYLQRYVIFFISVFLILNLPYLFHWRSWYESILYHANGGYKFILKGHPLTYFFTKPAMGIGWELLVLAIAGIMICLFKLKNRILLPIHIFTLFFYIFLSTTYGATPNWHIPLIPFLIVYASVTVYTIYDHINKSLSKFTSYILISVLLICVSIVPLFNIYNFKMNITEVPETDKLLQDFFRDIPEKEWILNRSENIHSVSDLNKGLKYVVFTNDWFSAETHQYPAYLMHPENFQKRTFDTDWILLRKHVEENWTLQTVIAPKHTTSWTNNTSLNSTYYIYRK